MFRRYRALPFASEENIENRNMAVVFARDSIFNTAFVFGSNSLFQAFIASRGVDGFGIGLIGTSAYIVQVLVYLLFMSKTDSQKKPIAVSAATTFPQILFPIVILLLNAGSVQSSTFIFIIAMIITVFINVLATLRNMFMFKTNLHMVKMANYSRFIGMNGIVVGIISAGCGFLSMRIMSGPSESHNITISFVLSAALIAIAAFVGMLIKPLHYQANAGRASSPLKAFGILMKIPLFRNLIAPNFMRGIGLGAGSLVLPIGIYRLQMTSVHAAYVVTATTSATILSCILYTLLIRHFRSEHFGLIGFAMWSSGFVLLMLTNSIPVYIAATFLSFLGQTFVDYGIPIALTEIIDPDIAGVYFSARLLVTMAGSAMSTLILGLVMQSELLYLCFFLIIGTQLLSAAIFHFNIRRFRAEAEKSQNLGGNS